MTALWLRAPLLLWRRPGVAAALFFAALVAIAPAATAPMLVSSGSAAALHSRVAGTCPWTTGSQLNGVLDVQPGDDAGAALAARTEPESAAFSGVPRVSRSAVTTVFRDGVSLDTPHGHEPATVRLATRTGFADHVKVLSGPSGDGLWVPSRLAAVARLRLGDAVSVGDFHSTVAAIYADLRDAPVDPTYWCSTAWLYTGRLGEGVVKPVPDLLLASQPTVLAAEKVLGADDGSANGVLVERTVDLTGLTEPQARRVAGAIAAAQTRTLSRLPAASPDFPTRMRSDLIGFTARADLVGRGVLPVTAAMSIAGSAVGLLALGIATSFWVRRRRRELIVLAAHGVGAPALGVKGVLEALPALLFGGAVAGAGSWLAVRDVGPSRLIDPWAVHLGLFIACGVFVLCLAFVGATATAGSRALIDVRPRLRRGRSGAPDRRSEGRAVLRRVPWELALAGLAVALWEPLGGAHLRTLSGDEDFGAVASVPLRLYVTPSLLLLAALILLVRPVVWRLGRPPGRGSTSRSSRSSPSSRSGTPASQVDAPRAVVGVSSPSGVPGSAGRARSAADIWSGGRSWSAEAAAPASTVTDRPAERAPRRSRPRGAVRLLVRRRLGRDAVAVAILVVATGIPVGLAVFSAAAAQTSSTTLTTQAELQNGADVVVHLSRPADVPPALRDRATLVRRVDGVQLGDSTVTILAIDPATFARGAFWDDRLGAGSLPGLLSDLTPDSVVAAYPATDGEQPMQLAAGPTVTVQVRAVPLLPASESGYPTAFALSSTLDRVRTEEHPADLELWVRGDPGEVRAAVAAAHLPVTSITDATSLYRHTWIEPVTYTFAYTIAIALLMGLVTTVGLVLYLEAGMPARKRAWVMLRRMGMRPGGQLRSLLAQIAAPVLAGAVLGTALAAGLAALTRADMDNDPHLPPDALLTVPAGALAVVGVAVLAVVAVTVTTTHLRTIRANPSVVLRDVE